MNRKGFTLIELLATILILSLLMLVAVPNVMSTIDKNKRDTYVEDAKRMITLAEYKVRSDVDIPLPTEGNCIVIILNALDTNSFEEGPEGGAYDFEKSYVVIGRKDNTYHYLATIVENFDGDTRGIPLISREELNKDSAKNKVLAGDDLDITVPTVGSSLNEFTVTNVIDS